MTATNHAITGVAIAIAAKRPELAIPLAFLSHFVLDMVPHYNPPDATKKTFKNSSQSWATKFADRNFRIIFIVDMVLLAWVLLFSPFIAPLGISSWTVFFSALAGAAPDFWLGRVLIYKKLGWKVPTGTDLYTRLHIATQFVEKPWGIYIELAWFVLILGFINSQLS